MAEDKQYITVVFKTEHERQKAEYIIGAQELDRLTKEFARSYYADGVKIGVYHVLDQNESPRRLMLRFADVLYIG